MKNQNNIILQNIDALREKINNFSPGLVKEQMPVLLQRKNCTETTFFLNKQFLMDDLSDILEKNEIVNILYARRTKDKKHYEVIAYSMPYDGEMFVIKLQSAMYKVVDKINISCYQSLDLMFLDIRSMYLTVETGQWIILEKQKPYILFANFN